MSRIFAYVRVSTTGQTTDNQVHEIQGAGFQIEAHRIVSESISGSTAAAQRPGFMKLLDRLEAGDVLVVTKLDRLGRNAMDIRATVERLTAMKVRTHCMQLGGTDLTSAAGKMLMSVIGAMAEFERDLLIERTQSGLERAKNENKTLGRKPTLSECERLAVCRKLADGVSVSELARQYKTSRQTILRARDEAVAGAQAA